MFELAHFKNTMGANIVALWCVFLLLSVASVRDQLLKRGLRLTRVIRPLESFSWVPVELEAIHIVCKCLGSLERGLLTALLMIGLIVLSRLSKDLAHLSVVRFSDGEHSGVY